MRASNFQYAVLGLVARRPEGVHGYQLKTEIEAASNDFWQVNYGRLYRVLDSLEQHGELDVNEQQQGGRPNRKVYRLTQKGKQDLDDWLLMPVEEQPQPLRDELSLKLLFLGTEPIAHIGKLVSQQRGIYLKRLSRLVRQRQQLAKAGIEASVLSVVMDGAHMRVRSDLAWLDQLERKILHEYGTT